MKNKGVTLLRLAVVYWSEIMQAQVEQENKLLNIQELCQQVVKPLVI